MQWRGSASEGRRLICELMLPARASHVDQSTFWLNFSATDLLLAGNCGYDITTYMKAMCRPGRKRIDRPMER
jgi:hypothetical protein